MNESLTLSEAADLLRCSTRALRRRIKAGALHCYWLNRQIRYWSQAVIVPEVP